MSNFLKRFLTSLVLVPILFFGIFKGEYISVAINKHQTVAGINQGIDEEGRLLIQESTKSEITKITTGSIQWR